MNIDHFLSWFNSTGVNTEYVHVQYSNHSGFGLYSSRTLIEKDSLVLSISEDLFLKPSYQNNNLTGFEHLIKYLLENQTDPYVTFLRSIQCIPLWRQFIHQKYPRQLKKTMEKHLNKFNQSRMKFLEYQEEDFQRAYYAVNTRCVHFDMEIESKDQDDNLCLIPYLDFVNHSIEANTISKFNSSTRSYEIRTIKSIDLNEQITFLYNPHSNVDLFIEYGFVLLSNPSNLIDIQFELEQILSNEQIHILKSYNYCNSLEFYSGDNDLSWTVIKAIELNLDQHNWSPYDDPSPENKPKLTIKLKQLLNMVKQNIEEDFQQWTTEQFIIQKNILLNDFFSILHDTSSVIDKSTLHTYVLLPFTERSHSNPDTFKEYSFTRMSFGYCYCFSRSRSSITRQIFEFDV